MGLGLILCGIIFFLNPIIRMVDLLPDLFGCILILIGISRLSALDHRLDSARKAILYMMAVSALRLPLSVYIPVKAKGYLLPFSFAFSVVEIIIMVFFFLSLIRGFEYLTSRDSNIEGHSVRSEGASVIAFVFSIARGVLSAAPELLVIGEQTDSFDYTFSPTPAQNAALIKPYAEILCFVIILILGIYTGFVITRYIIGLLRDKALISSLSERYSQYTEENRKVITLLRMRAAFLVLFVGIILLFNLILDGVNVLPNTLSLIFMAIGCVMMMRASKDYSLKTNLFILIPLIPLSIYNNITQYRLISETNIDIMGVNMTVIQVPKMLESFDGIPGLLAQTLTEYVLIAVFIIMIIRYVGNLTILRDNDTVSLFEILFGVFAVMYLASSVAVTILPFVRTAASYVYNDINQYIRYDSICAICEWASYISLILTMYFSYKHGTDVLYDIDAKE